MLITIILIAIAVITMVIAKKSENSSGIELVSTLVSFLFYVFFVIHIITMLQSRIEYRSFKARGEAIQATLNEIRKEPNPNLAISVMSEVAKYNAELEALKIQNKIFFIDPYIDDRIEQLKPLR